MAASFWCAWRAISQPLVLVLCISARSDGQLTEMSPIEMTNSRYRATCVLNSWTSILQSSRARWVLWALSEPLPLRSQSPLCSGGLLIWKIEERVDLLGRFLRPFGAELMHTHPPSRSRWCSAPRRGRPGRCPARRRRAAGPGTRGAALTGLGLAARVGNLQLEGELGKRWLCRAASLPLAARKGLGQVPISSTAGPVPGAGRWRGLAPPSPRHGLQGWGRRNAPPGGSEFPFRWESSFHSLRCQMGEPGGECRSSFGVFPQRR